MPERHVAGEMQCHHDHPRDPKEDDVEAGYEYGGGEEGFQIPGLLRPAERREWNECRGEPSVEHVRVAPQRAPVVLDRGQFFRFFFASSDVDIALIVIPGGNLVAPPKLARDAPVLDLL